MSTGVKRPDAHKRLRPVLGRLPSVPVNGLMNLRRVVEDALTPASISAVNASVYVTLSRKPAGAERPAGGKPCASSW